MTLKELDLWKVCLLNLTFGLMMICELERADIWDCVKVDLASMLEYSVGSA
jgi:hypothetical protein